MAKSLYRLTREEREIFEETRNGNYDLFSNYYFKGVSTGTWWTPGRRREPFKTGYNRLLRIWREAQKPPVITYRGQMYKVWLDHEESDKYPDLPAFHYNHGTMLLPQAKEVADSSQRVQVIIGGYGSAKTMSLSELYAIWAATIPEFQAVVLAPERKQAAVVYQKIMGMASGTLYGERFVVGNRTSPTEQIAIANDFVSTSIDNANLITCYPLQDPNTFKNLEFDAAIIEQSEMFADFDSIIEFVGSRMRGRTVRTGRRRKGVMHFIANSEFNPAMWETIEKAESEPDRYKVHVFSSYDNPYLTDEDLDNMEADVGGTEEAIRVKMKGGRPMGDGKKFTRVMLDMMADNKLDEELDAGLSRGESGYLRKKQVGVGTHEWGLPYKEGHIYAALADPGADNPPQRNAYTIKVWDLTSFPGTRDNRIPATIAHMVWGYGNGDTTRWANHFADLVHYYRCESMCAFDATGLQTGYDQWVSALLDLDVEKINMGGNGKMDALTSGRFIANLGLVKVPASFYGFYDQMSHYDYPETDKMRQDLVMSYIMSAWWMRRAFFHQLQGARSNADVEVLGAAQRIRRQGRSSGSFSRVRR